MDFEFIQPLVVPGQSRILLLVLDGVGGLPRESGGPTELEAAHIPHLDRLAAEGTCGLLEMIAPGITPGSGPGHLALFGYDPIRYQVGRGVLSAPGIDFDLQLRDVAARGNFCTVGPDGVVQDRRAGRIPTAKCAELCRKLRTIRLPGVEIFVEPEREHRFALIIRGENVSSKIGDTDPLEAGKRPRRAEALAPEAEGSAKFIRKFVERAGEMLSAEEPANMILLRGFGRLPQWPKIPDVLQIRPVAVAVYPMYRGAARLVGMEVLPTGEKMADELETVTARWKDFDFFYLHIKQIDSAGEDGDFEKKVKLIEEADRLVPELLRLNPDVVVVTGDHSTPAALHAHSWHPVPALIRSRWSRPDAVCSFSESACLHGGLGPRFPAQHLLSLALANARRLRKCD